MSFSPIRLKHSPMDEPRKSSRWIFPGWRARACRSMNVGCTMAAGDDICRIALTSGSTGEAKVVAFTHNNQLARLARYNHVFGKTFPECSRFFSDYRLGSSGASGTFFMCCHVAVRCFFPALRRWKLCKRSSCTRCRADRLAGRPQRIFTILRGQCRFPIRLPGHHLGRKAAPQIVVRTGAGKAVFESHFLLRHDRDIDRLIRARPRANRRRGGRGIYRARCIGAGRR